MILGSTNISTLKLGSSAVQKVMLGATEVWSAFSPLDLSPALWLSDTGSDASVWPDLSGNGRNATQGTSANRPAIITNALNGRQVRRFDGGDNLDVTAVSMLQNVPGASVVCVCKSTSGSTTERFIFSATTGTGALQRAALLVDNPSFSSRFYYGGRRLDSDSGDFSAASSAYSASAFYVVSAVFGYSAAVKNLFVNGASAQSDSSFQTAGNTSNTASGAYLQIGRNAVSAAGYFTGDIAEILVFPTALSDANRQKVEAWLNNKWAIY